MKFTLLLVTISVLSFGCSTGSGPSQSQVHILPLAVGNRWISQITTTDASGIVVSSRMDTMSVDSSILVDGERWYYTTRFWPPYSAGPRVAMTNRLNGLFVVDSGHFDRAYMLVKYPAVTADTFNLHLTTKPNSRAFSLYDFRVDTTNIRITVPAGVYPCNAYGIESMNFNGSDVYTQVVAPTAFYSPGVGPVQLGYFERDGSTISPYIGGQEIWQLVRADLK